MQIDDRLFRDLPIDQAFERAVQVVRVMGGISTKSVKNVSLSSSICLGGRSADLSMTFETAEAGTRIDISASSPEIVPYATGIALNRFAEVFDGIDDPSFDRGDVGIPNSIYWIVAGIVFLLPIVLFVLFYFHMI